MANSLTNRGEQFLLEIALRGGSAITALRFGLTNAALTPTSVLTDAEASEPAVANGYARVLVTKDGTGWPTSALNAGAWMLTSLDIVWTASGGAIPDVGATPPTFARVFLADGAVGVGTLLIGYWDLTQTSIADSDTLTFNAKIKLT